MIRVKRNGPRGWHWIAEANYDPAVHELVDESPVQDALAGISAVMTEELDLIAPAAPRRGRPPKARNA